MIGEWCFRSGLMGALFAATIGAQHAHAADIEHKELDSGLHLIIVAGEIVAGDEEKFRRLSVRFDKAVVALASEGGALQPAIEIGKMVRLKEFPTVVMDDYSCVSACALIWVAGSTRYLGPKGAVGFHASYRDEGGRKVETGLGNALVGRYLTLLNLPEKTVLFATVASPDEILWLNAENADLAGIDFEPFGAESSSPPPAVRSTSLSKNSPRPPAGWQLIASGESIDYYLDRSQTFTVDRYRAAWLRADHSKDDRVAYFESKDLWYYDCARRRLALKSWTTYDENGKMDTSHEVEDHQLDWKSVVPDSVGAASLSAVCG